MRTPRVVLLLTFFAVLALGCGSGRRPTPQEGTSLSVAAIPPDSPMANVKVGMGMTQVRTILGSPSDTEHYTTGKQFIPFYFAGDIVRVTYYYKGLGRVVSSNERVVRIEYDPTEDGFK